VTAAESPPVSISVIILAYQAEPWLERSVAAALDSTGALVEVILVDNGCTDGAVERLTGNPGVVVVSPGRNLGFAGGCNAGAERASHPFLGFVNGDAVVARDALAQLAEVASRPEVGIATASVRLADQPELLNSAGNDVHFLGLSWSGAFGEPATAHASERDVTGASGAGMVLSRATWDQLGGFCEPYFAYHEDAELSLRCWQRGWRVVYVPGAVVLHRYEFSRNRKKLYLVERNRLVFTLTLFETRTLLALAPALVALELGMLVVAARQSWAHDKLAGWLWIARNVRWVHMRRGQLQRERSVSDHDLAHRFATRWTAGNVPLPKILCPADRLLAAYWSVVRRLL
jgi:GT2 family glycosyltransferase